MKFDEIVVIQVRTTSWSDNDALSVKLPIELGVCLLNVKSLRAHDSLNIIINPFGDDKEEISEYCTKKTGLTTEDVSEGILLLDVFELLQQEYDVQNRSWASYGTFAKAIIKQEFSKEKQLAKNKDMKFPFSNRFIDVRTMFNVMFDVGQEISLKDALKKLKIEAGNSQDCEDEVLNVSLLLKQILRGPMVLSERFSTITSK